MTSSYVGYLASALVLCTFLTRTMMPLRMIALGSNVAFIAYGALLHLYPVLVLHIVLLPVNAWRLREIFALVKSVQETADDHKVFKALLPFAKRIRAARGEVVIRNAIRRTRSISCSRAIPGSRRPRPRSAPAA